MFSRGGHLPSQHSSPIAKTAVAFPGCNPIEESRSPKTGTDRELPVAWCNRRDRSAEKASTRITNRMLNRYSLNLCGQYQGEDIEDLYNQMYEILGMDGYSNVDDRLLRFVRDHLETTDPTLSEALRSYHRAKKGSSLGNENASAATNQQKEANADLYK